MNMLVNLDHLLKDWGEHFNMFFLCDVWIVWAVCT